MFHRNLYILAIPLFVLWYELIIGKLITIAYRLNFITLDYKIGEHVVMWTEDPNRMLELKSLDGLELLIIGGFMQWHYMYSIIFGCLGIAAERAIASVLIENYESNTDLFIPIILTVITQTSAISMSLAVLFHKVGQSLSNFTWFGSCILSTIVYIFVKKINESFNREIKNPRRKRIFTISQQFQVKENIRALKLGTRLVFVVLACIALCGAGIIALNREIIPSFYCHFVENFLFLNPYAVSLTAMFSVPQWEKQFKKTCLTFRIFKIKTKRKPQPISVELIDDSKKKLDMEADLYFKQLTESWI